MPFVRICVTGDEERPTSEQKKELIAGVTKLYATASEIFAKGYAADPDNTGMALNLAMSYCEMAMSSGDMSQYEKGNGWARCAAAAPGRCCRHGS